MVPLAVRSQVLGEALGARRPRSIELLAALTRSDLRARYGRGPFRLVKWLSDPFWLVGVYLLLVSVVLSRGGPAPGLSLACAVVPFQLVMMAVISGFASVWGRASVISNMPFPRGLIPLASMLTETLAFASSFLLIAVMMLIYGVAPTGAVLWLPVVLAVNLALAMVTAYPAALVGLAFRELLPFATSAVRTLFFVAPGLVTLDEITGRAHDLVKLNPLTGLFEAYRAVLVHGDAPAAWHLLVPAGAAVAIGAVFLPMYRRSQDQFAKVVE